MSLNLLAPPPRRNPAKPVLASNFLDGPSSRDTLG
jgi:hypothetical protein